MVFFSVSLCKKKEKKKAKPAEDHFHIVSEPGKLEQNHSN